MTSLDGWHGGLSLLTVVTSGLIAGQMLAIGIANAADRAQPEADWTRRFQFENVVFTRTMPAALTVPLLGSAACSLFETGPARAWFLVTTALLAIVLAITMAGNVPINNQVAAWIPGAAPATWTRVRDRWLVLHTFRTMVGIVAFIAAVIASNQA